MTTAGVLDAAGEFAQSIAALGWVLIAGGAVIFAFVMVLLWQALRGDPRPLRPRLWILGGGLAFPVTVLAALYVWTLPFPVPWKPVPPAGALIVSVTGHMWWWEVRYRDPATGADVVTANEIRIPVGRPVYLALASRDVIHSFWVPALAGKMDMVPGRQQHLLLSAARPGTYRGQCAEFCGEQHARMALQVVALAPESFDAWLASQARPAAPPATARLAQGRQVFADQRCGACHTVRGTDASGRLAPDLTHVGSRLQLAAGTLANDDAGRRDWIAHVQRIKTGARMPSYDRLDDDALGALSEWLGSLQ